MSDYYLTSSEQYFSYIINLHV